MSWLRIDDRLIASVKIRGLVDDGVKGDRAKEQRNATIGHWLQLLVWVAGERTDGFVTADVLETYGTKATAARLLRARFDRAPLLHERSADGRPPACPCLDGRSWPADFEYALHDYLERNPSRSENDVHRAKKRELRDAKLKRAVRDRDRDLCRYCGKLCRFSDRVSDDGLTFDHVDPEIADGMNNLVVACRGCNRQKGRRTPEQAGMALLDLEQPTTGPVTEPATVTAPDLSPGTSPDTGPSQDLSQVRAPAQDQRSPGRDGDGSAPGMQVEGGGQTTRVGPPDTPRPHTDSPYGRPSRPFPENHAGHPPRNPRERHDFVPSASFTDPLGNEAARCAVCQLPAANEIHQARAAKRKRRAT